MQNIGIPGVFPFVVAAMLTLIAFRASVLGKRAGDKRYVMSVILGAIGAVIFFLIAIFQLLEVYGISFR